MAEVSFICKGPVILRLKDDSTENSFERQLDASPITNSGISEMGELLNGFSGAFPESALQTGGLLFRGDPY